MSQRVENTNEVIILSHTMDADGICSAAILKAVIKYLPKAGAE